MIHRVLPTLACCAHGTVGCVFGAPWRNAPVYPAASRVVRFEAPREQGSHYLAAAHIAGGYHVYRRSLKDDATGNPVHPALHVTPGVAVTLIENVDSPYLDEADVP